jgi:hypothetical protein
VGQSSLHIRSHVSGPEMVKNGSKSISVNESQGIRQLASGLFVDNA